MNAIIEGFYVCIMLQIALLGITNFFEGRLQNQLLGIFSLLLLLSAIKSGFWMPFRETALYDLLGGPHEILFAPVLYAYILSIKGDQSNRFWVHIIFSFVIYLLIHPVRILIFGPGSYPYGPSLFFLLVTLCFTIPYLVKGLQLLQGELRHNLKEKYLLRISIFYIAINAFILTKMAVKLPLVINYLLQVRAFSQFNRSFTFPLYLFLGKVVFVLFCLLFVYYLFTETHRFKRYFVFNYTAAETPKINESKLFFLQGILEKNQIPSKNMNVDAFLRNYELDRQTLKHFLQKNGFANFSEFINGIRIRNFKEKIRLQENQKFDLTSLAKEAGFKSKASFYRIFKNAEGQTPASYIAQMNESREVSCLKK